MEVQSAAAGGSADLLMECDEEEQEVWPQSPDREKEEEEGGHNKALEAVISPIEETDLPPVGIIPIPVQAVSSCIPPTHHNKVKSTGAPLGFKVNGRLVLLSGGNAAELKLHSHPGGSASGFTKVQIHSPAAAPAPEADPTPIITGVVSGEAAQKVLSVHSVNFVCSPPLPGLKTPSSGPTPPTAPPFILTSPLALTTPWTFTLTSPWTLISPQTTPTPPVTKTAPPALTNTPPAIESTPPATETTPPDKETTPSALMITSVARQATPPATQTPAALMNSPPAIQTSPSALMNTPPAVDMTPSALMITPLVTPAALLTTPPASKTTPAASKTKPAASKTTPLASKTKPPVSKSTQPPPSSSKPATPLKLKLKGQLGPVPPPDCCVCLSQYKLITELRGFMCLCSPAVAQGLKNLKKKKNWRRIKEKSKTSKSPRDLQTFSKVSKTRPASSASKVITPFQRTHRQSDDFILDRFSPAPSSTTCSPQKDKPEPPPDPPHGKLVIMVEDFYYGCDPGRKSFKSSALDRIYAGPYRCIHCPMSLRNNIKLMSHMKQHVSMMSQEKGDLDCVCPHCFRRFLSPFKLQCHLEAVHSQYQSTAKCKICELEFGSEASFLWHMKSTHKPGEMPYICQVCNFRSSFYSDIWSHFHQVHADTKYLLCQYCLRVMRSNTCYQQHFARHQRKHVFGCDKCRLHFLYLRERIEHKLYHGTHIRPPQLIGLKPGTKVTVRTYSVVRGSENEEELKKTVVPCKVVEVDPPPPMQEAPKRKPVTRLGPLLSTITQESVSCPSQLCVECLSAVQNFETHFPSLVHCSLCRFITCCSTSYANHMINNHATCRKNPPYLSIFQSEPGLSQTLRCVSCEFTTCRGDVMANHLTERPEHCCIILTQNELRVNGAETQNQQPTHNSHSVISSVSGAFIPIHLIPSGQTSTQLSVKQLTSPTPLSSLPAMSIKFLGPRLQPDRRPASPLLANQLSAVLSSLCYGLPQACRCHQTSPLAIQSWIRLQEHHLSDRKWCWRTDKLAEWVLNQREQQFSLSEDVLLQTARTALGEDSQLVDCYSWIVDFMLRHELSLQPTNNSDQQQQHYRGRLPKSVRDNSRTFIHSLSTQIQSRRIPPQRVGSMDEFSIFIDSECFLKQNPLALQLFGSPEQEPVFDIILSGLFEGTFLPPLLFFRGTPSHIPEGFPENILLEARQEGFTDQERLDIWIDKVWRPHLASQSNSESLLTVDIHHGHLTDEFRRSLTSVSTGVAFIPSGCSCRLQPIDVCVMPVLRDFLQAQWIQLVSEGGLDGLGLDQLALTVACWLSEVSSTLNSEKHILRRSFASVCNLQQVEDRRDAMKMITALTEALVQPLETSGPPPPPQPEPEPQLELLLVMEEEVMEAERKEDMEQDPEKVVQDPEEVELLIKSPSALHQVFSGDSEQESFHGFMDD